MFGVIIGLDIERYSKSDRTDELQLKREQLSGIVSDATDNIDVFRKKEVIDTGDGAFILIDTGNYEEILNGLENIISKANEQENIRFRCLVHIGKYNKSNKILADNNNDCGYVGDGINVAARYLDSKCLKELLKENKHIKSVYGVSNEFYQKIYDDPKINVQQFVRYGFKVKEYNNLIYLNSNEIKKLPIEERIVENRDYELKDEFSNFLNRSDFVHDNENGQKSDLETFYVYPELNVEKPEANNRAIVRSKQLLEAISIFPKNIIISGDEQSGKTSLCKMAFKSIINEGKSLPVYLKFDAHEKGKFENKIKNAVRNIYKDKEVEELENRIKYLILDDFDLLDNQEQTKYIDYILETKNIYALIIVDSIFNGSIEKRKLTDFFKSYGISEFGHILRNSIIRKWIDFNCLEEDNYCTEDELYEYLDHTFIKGIIPFTPFYILTVLAARSGFVPLNGDLTSKGHCYQALIYISLRKLNIPEKYIGSFLNIFSNIAFNFFENGVMSFTQEQLESFFNSYLKDYNVPFDYEYFENKISKSTVFYRSSIKQYTFYASYFFQYFVAKYLADRISEDGIYETIEKIYNNLQNESFAYIGIFLVHHSKDIKILDEVLINTMVLYDQYDEISLDKSEIRHIDDYAISLNSQIIEKYDKSKENREEFLRIADNKKIEETHNPSEINNELTTLKKALRTLEVMGHILKNHSGELKRDRLNDSFKCAVDAYRRICNRFVSELREYEEEYIDFVVDRIHQMDDNSFTRKEIIEFGHRFFTHFNLLTIYSTIKRCSDSLGSAEMMSVISDVTAEINNPISYCIYLQCEMWYKKTLPIEPAKKKYHDFPVSVQHVIQRLIKEFTDLHHIDYKTKQRIASAFNMRLQALDYDSEK